MRKNTRTLTDDPVMLRILEEMEIQGRTAKDVERFLGMSNGAFTKWKYGGVGSYRKYLKEIAYFLNVSEEYLSCKEGRIEKTQGYEISLTEMELIEKYRKLDPGEQSCILKTMEYFLNSSEFRKIKESNELYLKKYNLNKNET